MEKNKKRAQLPLEAIIFIILNLFFFSALFVFVYRSGNQDYNAEEEYAKKIALAVDSLEPNSEILFDISYLQERASKNRFTQQVVLINPSTNIVHVQLSEKTGYSFSYFTSFPVFSSELDKERKILKIKT